MPGCGPHRLINPIRRSDMRNETDDLMELRTLSADELDHASGAALQVLGGVALGLATNAIYDWLKAPGKSIPEFMSYLKD
jgi:hypothetical protein